MSVNYSLYDLLENSAKKYPKHIAVKVPNSKKINYKNLSSLSDKLRDRLIHIGVKPGDRIAFILQKSIDSVASIFGILKAGAAYVPIDAESPAARCAYILNDCQVKCLITEDSKVENIKFELNKLECYPELISINESADDPLYDKLNDLNDSDPAKQVDSVITNLDDIAYILYTSGSTGNPKGVVLSNGNAKSFIDWCSDVFQPKQTDIFSSHAPFHFDLSILDIYVSIKHSSTLVLIGEELGKNPMQLAEVISSEKITMWYSTPSILSLLANFGRLSKYDYSALRMVFFAGEVFPIPQYLSLFSFWNKQRYFNLYGPTETNVCTYYEVPKNAADIEGMKTFPIGDVCPPNQAKVVDENNNAVSKGAIGELVVCGTNVMQGYWNLPELNSKVFFVDNNNDQWYRTGDIVFENKELGFQYVGRRDRMVKRRGFRVELGEIEVSLQKNENIRENAVMAIADEESGIIITPYVVCKKDKNFSLIELKTYSSQNLPHYMIPDKFVVLEKLPRTSTDKIDYQTLKSYDAS